MKAWACLGAVLIWTVSAVAADKIHPRVLEHGADGEPVEFLVFLEQQTSLGPALRAPAGPDRGRRVFEALTETAARTQSPLLQRLEAEGIEHRPFWIANMIWVRADVGVARSLASRNDVRRIDANPRVRHAGPTRTSQATHSPTAPAGGAIEWGVQQVRADDVWGLGYNGSGIVIGGQDTGYEWGHPALMSSYRGFNGTTTDHAYSWHDAIHDGGGSCGSDSPVPCDDSDHGTHTMGTMIGDDGNGNHVGVAPGASWVGCRNMNQGDGTPASYAECFQWFVAPTDLSGNNPDPAKAPHVINNSWHCPESEGCSYDTLRTVVENVKAAGIVVVASAGNAGDDCGSMETPPAIYDAAFSVAATDSSDDVAWFSSRGPVTIDGSDRLKPDVAAPGVDVRSSVPGGGYESWDGTSMAGPHAAGVVALILDARPDLIGRVDEVQALLRASSFPRTSSQSCGGFAGSLVPNPVYGHGRLDAYEALVGDADGDGTANLGDCSPVDGAAWAPPSAVTDLRLSRTGMNVMLSWSEPATAGADTPGYDVLKSSVASDFAGATCTDTGTVATQSSDSSTGGTAFYLVRIAHECGAATGAGSSGGARIAPDCP